MKNKRFFVVWIALITFISSAVMPFSTASAFSLTDLLSPSAQASSSSGGKSLMDLLLGLFLGNIINKTSNPSSPATPGKSLPSGSSVKGEQLIASAKAFMGVPYVWGGETPDGFDCSGFTQYVMKQNGISLPRTAAEQFEVGTPVNKTDLKIGDLVFFTTYKPGASHVGFYMGDGNFIHASSAQKKVGISSLADDYYVQHYIGARRYIN